MEVNGNPKSKTSAQPSFWAPELNLRLRCWRDKSRSMSRVTVDEVGAIYLEGSGPFCLMESFRLSYVI